MFKIIQKKANSLGYDLLRVADYPHKNDHYLKAVIAKKDFEYVSWIYNVTDDSFNHGYYTSSFKNALEKLDERISE